MTQLAFNLTNTAGHDGEPASADAGPAIDRAHLGRVTYGDLGLERELLELFDRQATLLIARMRDSEAAAFATLAHTLKGSAAGIGATGVAAAAASAEAAAPAERQDAVARLSAAVERARAEIAALLKPRAKG
jgi:HPt (histidine-containing phosphotransfer) domain-containing protein